MSSNIFEAVYVTQDKILSQKDFPIESNFKEVLDYFNQELFQKNDSKIVLKNNYFYKQFRLNESTKIKDILTPDDLKQNEKPKLFIKLNDLTSKDDDSFSYILRPKINPFGFIIYSVKANTIYEETLQKNLFRNNNLDKYNPESSAYCNSFDAFYISGGSKPNRAPVKDFWIVNYTYKFKNKKFNFQITNIKMPVEKKQHSMIYYKKDNCIYIIGGNDKTCLKYDIKEKSFSQLPETNTIYIKPALYLKNDILYIFDSFDKKKLFFEKLDLNYLAYPKKKQIWEKFYPKNYDKYISQAYGICDMDLEDKIILLGGERFDNNIILYEIKNNKLEDGEGQNAYAKLNDKTFYKINKNFYISIPEFRVKENWLVSIDNVTKNVSRIFFDEEGKTIFNFDSIEECDVSKDPFKKEEESDLLKSNINLSEIKNKSGMENLDINFQLNDKDSDNMYVLREPFDAKKNSKPSNFQLSPNYNTNNNVYIKKKYLNYEGDDWINKKFDNYKLYNMTPNYKKNKGNVNKITQIKNPLIKSRIIETKKIEGNEYSFIHEKIIDKDNLKLYNSFDRMSHSYDYENIYGNHRFYLSRYSSDGKNYKNKFEDDSQILQMSDIKYNINTEKIKKNGKFMEKFENEHNNKNKKNIKNIDNNMSIHEEGNKITDNNKNTDNKNNEKGKEKEEQEEISDLINNIKIIDLDKIKENKNKKNKKDENINEETKKVTKKPKQEKLNNNNLPKVNKDIPVNKMENKNAKNISFPEKERKNKFERDKEKKVENNYVNNNIIQFINDNEILNDEKNQKNENKEIINKEKDISNIDKKNEKKLDENIKKEIELKNEREEKKENGEKPNIKNSEKSKND